MTPHAPPAEEEIDLAAAQSDGTVSEDTEPDPGAAPAGAGPRGSGPQMLVCRGRSHRPLQDGAGLCSLGTWEPEQRPLCRVSAIVSLRAAVLRQLASWRDTEGIDLKEVFGRVANKELTASPFPEMRTRALKSYLMSLCGHDALPREGDRDVPIHLRLLQKLMSEAGDPDSTCIDLIAPGVPIGVGTRLPRTPAVYARKKKWSIAGQQDPEAWRDAWEPQPWRDNYSSADAVEEEIERQLEQLVTLGKASRLTPEELHRRWPDAAVASLGALTSKGKVRILYDGTHGANVNPRIRVRDKDRGPCTSDVKRVLRAQSQRGRPTVGLTVDVADAHRIIPVREADWRYQVCRARRGGDLYAIHCGLFGISSAAYWWGRLAGAIVRLLHHISEPSMELWLLLVADDLKMESTARRPEEALLFVLWVLELLGVPLQWEKTEGGDVLNWVGYQFSYASHSLGLSESRASWAAAWCQRHAETGGARMSEFREGLGRLGFVVGALAYDAPFLSPLYSYAAVVKTSHYRILPTFVRLTMAYLASRIRRRRSYSCAQHGSALARGPRVDAMAEQGRIGIGGWLPQADDQGNLRTDLSPWFATTLDQSSAPWAFTRGGQPFRVISALEAFGTLLSIRAFSPWLKGVGRGTLMLKAYSDNQGNTSALNKLSTTKYPLNVVTMELASTLEDLGLQLDLRWVPRDLNEEADNLSKGIYTGFEPSRRVPLAVEEVKWHVLDEFMKLGANFCQETKRLREQHHQGPAHGSKRRRGDRLRDREPW